jgi:hypothetical protein
LQHFGKEFNFAKSAKFIGTILQNFGKEFNSLPKLGVEFLVYFEQASEQVYKKNSGDKQTRESRLPNVLITGESGLPDVFCLETISNF